MDEPEQALTEECVTVLTSNSNHFKQFRRAGAKLLMCPTWSLEELLDAQKYLFNAGMTQKKPRDRYACGRGGAASVFG